jgi:8-oxo-dGTP pyrophosphatase MutT (NUDIX family)
MAIKLAAIGIIRHPTEDNLILVSKRLVPEDEAGLWQLAGGAVNDGEDPHRAAHREVREETGMPVTGQGVRPFVVSEVLPNGDHGIMLIYEFRADRPEIPPNPEPDYHTDWEWRSAQAMADPSYKKFLAFERLYEKNYFSYAQPPR